MKPKIFTVIAMTVAALAAVPVLSHRTVAAAGGVPRFEPDPYWPKPLPNNWISGGIGGIYVDSQDHIWVINRPKSVDKAVKNLAHNPPDGDCCIPAPTEWLLSFASMMAIGIFGL